MKLIEHVANVNYIQIKFGPLTLEKRWQHYFSFKRYNFRNDWISNSETGLSWSLTYQVAAHFIQCLIFRRSNMLNVSLRVIYSYIIWTKRLFCLFPFNFFQQGYCLKEVISEYWPFRYNGILLIWRQCS